MELFGAVVSTVSSIKTSLVMTLSILASALRHRRTSELMLLLREGSPLENLIESLTSAAFWILALTPVLLVPVYYLLLSLK